MSHYDFHQLTWYDLELLARDLIQAELKVFLESFKSGPDGGQDFRHAVTKDKIIGQVKHYLSSGFAKLLRQVKKEAPKVALLNPSRYILITSVKLSPAQKQKLMEAIGKKYLKSGDIIGQDELNNLLGKHPEIEKQHYKLWLASTAVLERVLHNAEATQSEFKVQQIHAEAKRYVPSTAYPQALEKLNEHSVALIAGPPGIGKTTLANLILYNHIEQGYQAVIIQRDVSEGLNLFKRDTKQIFYFDDFMGATFLGDQNFALSGNNDKALVEFINLISASPKARLIMTTREHIYSLAIGKSERLRHSDIDGRRVVLHLPSYSKTQRAQILYNHLYFSDLPHEYKKALLDDDFYLEIIKHKKFNPRLIKWLSSHQKFKHVEAKDFRQHVKALLDDPSEIWRHAYHEELSDGARSVLLTLFSQKGASTKSRVERGFKALHAARAVKYGFKTKPNDFAEAFHELRGAFITSTHNKSMQVVDPSILDLMNSVVRLAPENALDILQNAVTVDQVETLWSFAKAEKSQDVLSMMATNIEAILPAIQSVMLINRRVDHGGGRIAYYGSSFEKRVRTVCDMSKTLKSDNWRDVTIAVFDRLMVEWKTERPQINDAVEANLGFVFHPNFNHDESEGFRQRITDGLLADVIQGCPSDELREILRLFESNELTEPKVKYAFMIGFQRYCSDYYKDEIRQLQSEDEYDGLIEDLEGFAQDLGVNVKAMIEEVTDEKDEFLEQYDPSDEYDAYKEDRYIERAELGDISNMFGALPSDE